MSVTSWNERIASEMEQCRDKEGMVSVKVYMAYKETIGLDDDDILKVMDAAARLNLLVMVHCEHGETIRYLQRKFIAEGKRAPMYHPLSRPPEVEAEAVMRAVMMAKAAGCSLYIVHVSTQGSLMEIEKAVKSGQPVFAETCPHYLLLDEAEYRRPGFEGAAYVMSPPLRTEEHRDALWKAIRSGTIRAIATDHCPFNMKGQKDKGRDDFTLIPNGVAGVEHRMSLLFTYGVSMNRLTLSQFVDMTAEGPAKIFRLFPQKGIIAPGSDADIVLWDPRAESVISAGAHLHHCDTSIYEGFPIKGKPRIVIINGARARVKE
jgi:dihydropyrimidinase